MTEDQPDTVEEVPKEKESPKMVTLTEDQFNQMMTQMTNMSQQLDFLKNQVEASKEVSQTREIPDADAEEAVMHTLSKMKAGREMVSTIKKKGADEMVELAIDYALADYMKNPPKNRRKD